MGRTWPAIKEGIGHGIIFRTDLKKHCIERENISAKTFNENIRRNVKKFGELAEIVLKRRQRRIRVSLLRKDELWARLEGIHEKARATRNVAILSLKKSETGTTSHYPVTVENRRSQPIQQVLSRLLLIDPRQSEILHDQNGAWPEEEHETELFKGFPQRFLVFALELSPTIAGGENEWSYTVRMGGKEEFNVDKHFVHA